MSHDFTVDVTYKGVTTLLSLRMKKVDLVHTARYYTMRLRYGCATGMPRYGTV